MSKKINGFYMRGRAHYSKRLNIEDDSIMVGVYFKDGGSDGEFKFYWNQDMRYVAPQLISYDDSWKLLKNSQNLLQIMEGFNDHNITIDMFKDKLIEIGYTDLTQYEDPDKTSDSELYDCPCDAGCRCAMEKPCKGCETWARYQENKLRDGNIK